MYNSERMFILVCDPLLSLSGVALTSADKENS